MNRDDLDLLPPRILIVDDERQIHASLRLRLAGTYELEFSFDAKDALEKVRRRRFDLCLVDIHMPKMDGLAFIDAAQQLDAGLGFVVLSAFDTYENLRRTIPLQVYEFISKPLPERGAFEARLPEWIERTRLRRRDLRLAQETAEIAADRDAARLERDVELVASETTRDALGQIAGLLTTIQAHLVAATSLLAARAKEDAGAMHLWRSLEQARQTADAATTVAEGFFDSAYGSRHESPALPPEGLRHAIDIALRMTGAEQARKAVEFQPDEPSFPLRDLSGIDFLLMMVPALAAALVRAAPDTTVGIRTEQVPRLDGVIKGAGQNGFLWLNRRHALSSHRGLAIVILARAAPFTIPEAEAWLRGQHAPLASIPARGLVLGIQKCHGLLGAAVAPGAGHFGLTLVLPT